MADGPRGENPFVVEGPMLKEIAQGLLEMKKMARSIENSADAFLPIVANSESGTAIALRGVVTQSQELAKTVSMIYHTIAREAMQT